MKTSLLVLGGVGFLANVLWAAETVTPTANLDTFIGPLANLGGMGFVVALAWYTITKTLPGIATEHRTATERLTAEHRAALERMTAEHHAAIEKLSTKFDDSLQRVLEDSRRAREELRDAVQKLADAHARASAEHRQAIDQLSMTITKMVQQCTSKMLATLDLEREAAGGKG